MTRLIDADKLPNIYTATHQEMIMEFEEAPTVEAKPIHRSTRTDENGVKWVLGEHGWVMKEE